MTTWRDIEKRRQKLADFSQIEMCRRAGISQSSIHKGLKTGKPLRSSTLKAVETVLIAEETAQAGRVAA